MILIISIPKFKLHEYEFVHPLVNILEKIDEVVVRNYKETFNPFEYDAIVISGTALKDFEYLNTINKFEWIRKYDGTIVGICSGAQILAKIYGCELRDIKIIGNKYICLNGKKTLAYFLISKIPILDKRFEILGYLDDIPVFFRLKNTKKYGFLFHPEVHNPDLLKSVVKDSLP